MDTSTEALIKLQSELETNATGLKGLWDSCGRLTVSRRLAGLAESMTQSDFDNFTLPSGHALNSVAAESANILATGCSDWITPADQPWFALRPAPMVSGRDDVDQWMSACTDILMSDLAASNFYQWAPLLYLDRAIFGVSAMEAVQGKKSPLSFRTFDVGSFYLADDADGNPDIITRTFYYTARQAEEEFGRENLPPEVLVDLQNKPLEKRKFLKIIYPRPALEHDPARGSKGAPIAIKWIYPQTKSVIQESGAEEMPVMASRWLRWSESSPYGISPTMEALCEIHGVQFLESNLAALIQTTVTPRIIVPQGYEGIPDLRAGGLTFGGQGPDSHPREWMQGGRIPEGMQFLERKEAAVRRFFHADLFQQFAQIDREMTATEVRAREAEKVARFSPAFAALTSEFINPLIRRVFMLLWRQGRLPAAPESLYYRDAAGDLMLSFPRIVQTSRMAMAMQALKRSAWGNMLSLWGPMIEAGHEVTDNLDMDVAFRDLARGDSMPTPWLKDSALVEEIRAKRAQALAEQQQAQMALEAVKSKPLMDMAQKVAEE